MYMSRFIILLAVLFFSGRGEAADFAQSDSIPGQRQRALNFKQDLLELFNLKEAAVIHSRKSCNCGCDIRKEEYVPSNPKEKFIAYDFCDSYVFEIQTEVDLMPDVSLRIYKLLSDNGFSFIEGKVKYNRKFRIDHYTVEGPDVLTFYEDKIYENGRRKIKISLSVPD